MAPQVLEGVMSVLPRSYLLFGMIAGVFLGSSHVALAQEASGSVAPTGEEVVVQEEVVVTDEFLVVKGEGKAKGLNNFLLVENDLADAMRKELYEAEKYKLFALQARARGNPEVAAAFEKVADRELNQHLRTFASLATKDVTINLTEQQAKLAALPVRSDRANLHEAIVAERMEGNRMSNELMNQALKYEVMYGNSIQVAEAFLNVGQGEYQNMLELRKAKRHLEQKEKQEAALSS